MAGPSNETEEEKRLERIALALERIAVALEAIDAAADQPEVTGIVPHILDMTRD